MWSISLYQSQTRYINSFYISTEGFGLPSNGHFFHIIPTQGLSFTINKKKYSNFEHKTQTL